MYRLSLLLLTLGWLPSPLLAAAPAGAPLVSFAEQPVRLWRDTGVYAAGRGTRLRDGDIIASGTSAIQLETGAATVALGPATQAYLNIKNDATDVVLLNGWMKIQAGAGKQAAASAGGIHVLVSNVASNGALILHASAGTTELFAESGEAVVDETHAGKRRQLRLAREQYAVKPTRAGQPMKLLARPSKQFLADMPPLFADRLVPLVVQAAAAAPKLEHAAVFAEVAPWLGDEPALRLAVQRRLAPRKPVPASLR